MNDTAIEADRQDAASKIREYAEGYYDQGQREGFGVAARIAAGWLRPTPYDLVAEEEGERANHPTEATVDERLSQLAGHLDYALGERLLKLVAADGDAHEVIDLRERTQRAEDLANECRRQLRARDRMIDDLLATHDRAVEREEETHG